MKEVRTQLSLGSSKATQHGSQALLQLLDDGRSHGLRVGEVDREQEHVPGADNSVMQNQDQDVEGIPDQFLWFDHPVDHHVHEEGRAVEGQGQGDGGESGQVVLVYRRKGPTWTIV